VFISPVSRVNVRLMIIGLNGEPPIGELYQHLFRSMFAGLMEAPPGITAFFVR
jgi:hypothetical protein